MYVCVCFVFHFLRRSRLPSVSLSDCEVCSPSPGLLKSAKRRTKPFGFVEKLDLRLLAFGFHDIFLGIVDVLGCLAGSEVTLVGLCTFWLSVCCFGGVVCWFGGLDC